MWRYCIQHQHILSEYGFIKCEYSNIIDNTVVEPAVITHSWSSQPPMRGQLVIPKMTFCIQMHLQCAATYIKRPL